LACTISWKCSSSRRATAKTASYGSSTIGALPSRTLLTSTALRDSVKLLSSCRARRPRRRIHRPLPVWRGSEETL